MRTLTRTILAAILLAALAVASAQTPPRAYFFTRVLAIDLDGVMVDCPFSLPEPAFCFQHDLDPDLLRMRFDSLIREYDDLAWVTPWQADGPVVARMIHLTSEPQGMFGVFILPRGAYGSLVFGQEIVE